MERNDNQQVLLSRRARLISLQQHSGWEEIKAEIERRRHRDMKALLNRALLGEEFENLKTQIDFLRGWEAALAWVLALPGGAEASLERFLTKEKQQA